MSWPTKPVMNALQEAIHWLAANQGPGRYLCPKCAGGSDGEKSLNIRLDEGGGVHWRCFRSSCGYTGGPRGIRSVFAERKREARHFTRPIEPPTEAHLALLDSLFGLNEGELEGYSPTDDRFILGVYGPYGYNKRGVLAYSLSGGKPKSLTYNEKPDEPFIHYAKYAGYGKYAHLVIVEDWFSAEKVATTGEAVGAAIMGTHLDQAAITEIAGVAARYGARTWLALDRDAYAKTIGYVARYREQFAYGLYAWSLAKDLKYETTERIKEALNGKNNFTVDVSKPECV